MRDLGYFRGGSTHVRRSAYRMHCCGGLQHADRRPAENEEPQLGAHLLTLRFGFTHHGIYVGEGKVIHYGPISRRVLSGPVAEVPLVCFSSGRPTWLRRNDSVRITREEVIAARGRTRRWRSLSCAVVARQRDGLCRRGNIPLGSERIFVFEPAEACERR